MVPEGVVLKHIMSNKGIEVNKAKVETIEKSRLLTSIRDVRSYFMACQFLPAVH